MRHADTALYEAKGNGRGRAQPFNEEIQQRLRRRLTLETELRPLCATASSRLHYQPQIDLISADAWSASRRCCAGHHPEFGPVSPAEFIPVAEDAA